MFKDKQDDNPGIAQAEYFWNPVGEVATQTLLNTDKDNSLQFHLQIGSKWYPEFAIASLEEAYYQLRRMLHKEVGETTIVINLVEYRDNRLSVGVETEKMGKTQAFRCISTNFR